MTTPTPYPWMEDSQYVTTPVVTGYLAVTSPNGLYLSNGSSTTTITPNDVSSTIFNGDLDGNAGTATTATTATNIAGGAFGSIPYQSATNTTALLGYGAAGTFLKSQGTTLAPIWDTPTAGTTVNVTSTNDGTAYLPTFVSTTGSGQILRADSVAPTLTYVPSTSTLSSTIFSTATAPASANHLGNKTYIDNFGGSGGWYYTTTISGINSATVNFPNCLSSTYNAYEIYFVPNLTSPTTGFLNLDMTFSGISTPTYQTYSQTQTTGGSLTNSYLTTAPRLLNGFNFAITENRLATIKLDLWGTRSTSGGAGTSRLTYLSEGFNGQNPGITSWGKTMGTVTFTSGNATGITFTYSVGGVNTAVVGSITIVVKAKY